MQNSEIIGIFILGLALCLAAFLDYIRWRKVGNRKFTREEIARVMREKKGGDL